MPSTKDIENDDDNRSADDNNSNEDEHDNDDDDNDNDNNNDDDKEDDNDENENDNDDKNDGSNNDDNSSTKKDNKDESNTTGNKSNNNRKSSSSTLRMIPGQEEPLKRMTKIVNALLAREDCAPFREPVDWKGLELYDYPQVIKKMMDLGTIKRRLERQQYQTAHQVATDIRLVWSNCLTYNADGSDFWLLAKSFSRRFEDRYRKVKQEFDVGEHAFGNDSKESGNQQHSATSSAKKSSSRNASRNNNSNTTSSSSLSGATPTSPSVGNTSTNPSLDARAKLGANLFLLSGNELGEIMTMLELECPEALETWYSPSRIEINIDVLPPKIFQSLSSFVYEKLGKPASKHSSSSSSNHHLSDSQSHHSSMSIGNGGGSSSKSRKKQRKS